MPNEDDSVPMASAEAALWKGHTSQWVHFWYYLVCVVLAAGAVVGVMFVGPISLAGLAIPLLMWTIQWWFTKTTCYELTSQRLRKSYGILSRTVEDLELFRVKDYTLDMPFFLRLLGLGNLKLVTSDSTTPVVSIPAVRDAQQLRELLRNAVQKERDRKRVRELDVDNLGEGGGLG